MSKTINKTVEGLDLNIRTLDVFKKAHLDAKIIKIVGPVIKGISLGLDVLGLIKEAITGKLNAENAINNVLESGFDMEQLIDGCVNAFGALDDKEREDMMMTLLSGVTVIIPGVGSRTLDNMESINEAFEDNMMSLYKVLWAVMEANKLTPFVLISRGIAQKDVQTSTERLENEKGSGKQ